VIDLTPRTGRPKLEEPKDINIKVRIDFKTNEKINDYCKKNNITKTDFLRKGIQKVLDDK